MYIGTAPANKAGYINNNFKEIHDFLVSEDLSSLPAGKIEICDGIFADVQEYVTVPSDSVRFETHEVFFDIHYLVSGRESVDIADLIDLSVETPYDSQNDITFYREKSKSAGKLVILNPSEFIVVAPGEAHKPRCSTGEPCAVKKVVFKVKKQADEVEL